MYIVHIQNTNCEQIKIKTKHYFCFFEISFVIFVAKYLESSTLPRFIPFISLILLNHRDQ